MALLSTSHIASNNIHYNYLYSDNKYRNTFIPGEIYPTTLCVGKGLRLTSVPRKTTTTTRKSYRRFNHARAEAAETMATTEKLGIKITRNPPETKLADLGVKSWPKWGCPPSKFPWTYSSKETCYLLKGKVKVYPDTYDEAVEIGAGDLVVFPKGMSCTWDVSETVDKHYIFE